MEMNKRVFRDTAFVVLAGLVLTGVLGMVGVTEGSGGATDRKIWMSDPAYNKTDGLVDYGNVNKG